MTNKDTLFTELDRLRTGYRVGRSFLFALITTCAFAAILLCFSLTDLFCHFPQYLCWTCWGLVVAALCGGGCLVFRSMRQVISDAAMAVFVEKALPDSDDHFINAVQLTEKLPERDSFVEEVLSETDLDLGRLRSRDLYSQRPAKWARNGLAGTVAVIALLFALKPRAMSHASLRLLLPMANIPPYTLTRIVKVDPGTVTVLRGESLDVSVLLSGALPSDATLIWNSDEEKDENVPLVRTEGKHGSRTAEYYARLESVLYDSTYRIVAGDTHTPRYRINVTNPPSLEEWQAKVIPPKYVGMDSFHLDSGKTDSPVPAGSEVILGGDSNAPLEQVQIIQDEEVISDNQAGGREKFAVKFRMREGGPVRVRLIAESGLDTTMALPFTMTVDQKPRILLMNTQQRIMAAEDAKVPIAFKAEDDHRIVKVGLERNVTEERTEDVTETVPPSEVKQFSGRFLVDVSSFGVQEGESLRFRVWGRDNAPGNIDRRGYSGIVQIVVPVREEQEAAREKTASRAKETVLSLIKMQRENLYATRALSKIVTMGQQAADSQIQELQIAQENIRKMGQALLIDRAALGDLANALAGLVNHEMIEVLEEFEKAHQTTGNALPGVLQRCVALQTRILAALTGIPSSMDNEEKHQEKTDLCAALQKLVARQRDNLKDSKEARGADTKLGVFRTLATVEDQLAEDLLGFTDQCLVFVEERVNDEFAVEVRKVYELLQNEEAYEDALDAAESLELGEMAYAIQSQEDVLRTLLSGLNILNAWRMKNAEKIVREATEVLEKTREKLSEMEADQARIAEVTRDLTSRGEFDDEVREKLGEMDEEQKKMADMIEDLAQDLYQFPELPVCNELNSMMREIFEDVEQAIGSENEPAKEIAVQKEDALLDSIRETEERLEDVEMWLPDVPDNVAWKMESFDTDEFPDIPLVPLPDELEDIVGELLDQASEIDEQAQDSTGNNLVADAQFGWGIADGPMPSFAAKGKSGNTRPNDNEMTGRSGAGREGQSTGEVVEDHVKGLEGRKTHARRTQDPFQQGMITEDEDSTMDARSTGGGKLGGESETIGMFGKAVRRDLHTGAHGKSATELRQETEALYATARLLYLGTGSLGAASRELRGIENAADRMKDFGSLHKRVLRRLEDTQVELSSGAVLPMPVVSVSKVGGAATSDVDINELSEDYRDIVSDYYRSLNRE